MGTRKRQRAEIYKEERKKRYVAVLRNCPLSPRKTRKVADLIRGRDVDTALAWLKHSPQVAARYIHKVLLSAIANWQVKNEGERLEDAALYVRSITVDPGRSIKRARPAAMGRSKPYKKRSNHITLELGSLIPFAPELENLPEGEENMEPQEVTEESENN